MNSDDDSEHIEETVDLIPSIQILRGKCTTILDQCKAWNDKRPIEGLHRYTNSLTAELHFIDKVRDIKKKGGGGGGGREADHLILFDIAFGKPFEN
jgi:hypothetical protein